MATRGGKKSSRTAAARGASASRRRPTRSRRSHELDRGLALRLRKSGAYARARVLHAQSNGRRVTTPQFHPARCRVARLGSPHGSAPPRVGRRASRPGRDEEGGELSGAKPHPPRLSRVLSDVAGMIPTGSISSSFEERRGSRWARRRARRVGAGQGVLDKTVRGGPSARAEKHHVSARAPQRDVRK